METIFNSLVLFTALTALIAGSYTDFKKREVPDWINYALIIFGIGTRLIFSVTTNDWYFLLYGLSGLLLFYLLALLMYYTGQWGGGDSKMIMGLGALVGFDFSWSSFMVSFMINLLFAGALYGLLWSFGVSIKHFKDFIKEFKSIVSQKIFIMIRRITLLSVLCLLIFSFFIDDKMIRLSLIILSVVLFFSLYVFVFIKSVEKACMIKEISPLELTEGDWVTKEIKVNGEVVVPKKNLGVEKPQIEKLIRLYKQKKIKKVTIKEGIPFVPAFLLSFIITMFAGNLLWYFLI